MEDKITADVAQALLTASVAFFGIVTAFIVAVVLTRVAVMRSNKTHEDEDAD